MKQTNPNRVFKQKPSEAIIGTIQDLGLPLGSSATNFINGTFSSGRHIVKDVEDIQVTFDEMRVTKVTAKAELAIWNAQIEDFEIAVGTYQYKFDGKHKVQTIANK